MILGISLTYYLLTYCTVEQYFCFCLAMKRVQVLYNHDPKQFEALSAVISHLNLIYRYIHVQF